MNKMRGVKVTLDDLEFFMNNQELPEMGRFTVRGNTIFLYAFVRSRSTIHMMMDAIDHICVNPQNVVIFMQSYNDNILNVEPYVQEINTSRHKVTQVAMKNNVPVFKTKEETIAYILGELKSLE